MIDPLIKIAINNDSELHHVITFIIKIILTGFLSVKLYGVWIGSNWLNHLPTIEEIYFWFSTGEIIISIATYFIVWFFFYQVINFILFLIPLWFIKKSDKYVEALFNALKNISLEEIKNISTTNSYDVLKSWGFIVVVDNKLNPSWLIMEVAKDVKKNESKNDRKKNLYPYVDPSIVIHFLFTLFFVSILTIFPWWLFLIGLFFLIALFLIGILNLTIMLLIDKYKLNLISLVEFQTNINLLK